MVGDAGSEPAAPLVDLGAGFDDVGVGGEGVEIALGRVGERTAASMQVHVHLLGILQELLGVEIDLGHAGDRVRLGFSHCLLLNPSLGDQGRFRLKLHCHLLCDVDSPGSARAKPRAAADAGRRSVGLRMRVVVDRRSKRR